MTFMGAQSPEIGSYEAPGYIKAMELIVIPCNSEFSGLIIRVSTQRQINTLNG